MADIAEGMKWGERIMRRLLRLPCHTQRYSLRSRGVFAPVANWLPTVVVLPAKSVKNRITSFNEKTGPHHVGGKPVY